MLICNSGESGLTRAALTALGSERIFLDAAVSAPTIYSYLKTGLRLVGTPPIGERTTPRWLSARTFTADEALRALGDSDADLVSFDADDRRLLLSALLVKLYFRSNGLGEKECLAKMRRWPASTDARRRAVRDNYMDIVRGNNGGWTGTFLSTATRAVRERGLMAAEPTSAQDGIINNPRNYEFYFNSTLTMRYDADPTPFTAPQSTSQNAGGLPAPITLASLRQCGGVMEAEADAESEESETGVRQELRTVRSYAERHGTRVYAQQATGGFWVAVGL